jgi:hypothetical protein
MKYAVEMGSGAMIYVPSFITIGSGIRKLMGEGGGHTQPHKQDGDRTSLLLFFENKESKLKKNRNSFFKKKNKGWVLSLQEILGLLVNCSN